MSFQCRAEKSGARFSVVWGDEQQPDVSQPEPQTRLIEFFEGWFVPHYARGRPGRRCERTLAETRTWVHKFADLIGDLPLGRITLRDCEQFHARALMLPWNLYKGPDYPTQRAARKPGAPRLIRRYLHWRVGDRDVTPRTVQKGLIALQAVFDAAGPRSRQHKQAAADEGLFGLDAQGRMRSTPWFPDVQVEPSGWTEQVFSIAEVSLLLRACAYARQPLIPGIRPCDWWLALFRFLYNSGLRIGMALGLQRSMIGRNLLGETFLAVPARIDKKGKPRLIVLNSFAVGAIEALPSKDYIFPCPHTRKHLLNLLRELEAAAGLPADRRFGFHAFRRATGTRLYEIDPAAAQEQLGHGDRRTTVNHYVAAEALVRAQAARVLPALERLPQPAAPVVEPSAGPPQLWLF